MTRPVEILEAEFLQLPTAERARLLDSLVASLDIDRSRDLAWDHLAAQREVLIEAGDARVLDGPETVARLRAKLGDEPPEATG